MAKTTPFKRVAASGASDRGDAAIYDLLGYQAIARAGQPQSLTGESVIQLGALIAQMDFDDPLEEEALEKTDEEKKESTENKLEDIAKTANEKLNTGIADRPPSDIPELSRTLK